MEKREILYPGKFYHIYNRGINKQNIYFNNNNYQFFLNKIDYYLSTYLDFYANCLMPNHFHLLVKIKEDDELINLPGTKNLEGFYLPNNRISKSFSNFFNAYVKAINKQQNRTGSLFQKNFKRKHIDRQNYLTQIIYYIHLNPVLHKYQENYENYKYSSYMSIVSEKSTKLKRNEILDLFGNKSDFINYHKNRLEEKLELEDFFLE